MTIRAFLNKSIHGRPFYRNLVLKLQLIEILNKLVEPNSKGSAEETLFQRAQLVYYGAYLSTSIVLSSIKMQNYLALDGKYSFPRTAVSNWKQ